MFALMIGIPLAVAYISRDALKGDFAEVLLFGPFLVAFIKWGSIRKARTSGSKDAL
jgi:hypothetical protein